MVTSSGGESLLDDALGEHRVGNLDEAGDVGAIDVTDLAVCVATMDHAGFMDVAHDLVEAGIDLLPRPGKAHGVLAHFQARRGNAAGIAGLAWGVEHAVTFEYLHGLGG